ncbi:MAG: response regulator [Candidatus Hinthialibacter antarcticus]|nr:response regulator [Candidatus Hinthialibacter antarcticus]
MTSFEDQLRAEYVEKIDGLVQALETASHSFRTGDPGAENSIRRIAHMLRGSGATYGFPEITQTAQIVEESAESDLVEALDALLTVLRQTSHTPDDNTSILIIDDDASSADLLKVVLTKPDRDIQIAYDAAEAKALIAQNSFSLIVLDIVLSDVDGRDFLMKLRQAPKTASIPILIVTGLVGDQPRQECMALGATHFFAKPYELKEIGQTVTDELEKHQVGQSNERTDLDTGLPNRAEFCVTYDEVCQTNSKAQLVMAFIDIDSFSMIQDRYGSENARLVIIRTAALITEQLNDADILARWNGEDLVVLFPSSDVNQAKQCISAALENLRSEPMSLGGADSITLTFSAGIASVSAPQPVDEAVLKAQRFCYLAKSEGRNRIAIEQESTREAKKTLLLAEDDELIASIIKHRLGREGFEVAHFTDGESALNAAQERLYSIVVLDVKMPVMDGFEVLSRLRETSEYAKRPIVLLTAMGSEKDIVRGFKLGANDYILKPFSPVQLLARVQRLLKA